MSPPLVRPRWQWPVAFDHCRVLLPQFAFAGHADALARLHRLALDDDPVAAARPGRLRALLARPLFAVVALRLLGLYLRRYGAYVRRQDGISYPRQVRDLWHCLWRHNQNARHYYWRKLYLRPVRRDWLLNLEHRQLTTLLHHLNRRLPITRATDKHAFHQHCLAHALPTPALVAAWTADGRGTPTRPAAVAGDLFLKPTRDFGSRGAMVIPYDAASRTHRWEGRPYPWVQLMARLGRRALDQRHGLIVQTRLRNARRQACYGDDDICNLRLVTGCAPGGVPELIGGFMRLPSRCTTTGDDRHVLVASIDDASGRLKAGRFRDITRGEFPLHPATGAPIAGRMIPAWAELRALGLRAHHTLPWLPFVGWDLVDSDQGIVLLEANAYWGGDVMQSADNVPLGLTRFPAIYLAWFEHLHRGGDRPHAV
jgi:hypothetical protein